MWYLYILECRDKSLYTGIAKNIDQRVKVHNSGQGSAYTRSHLPVRCALTAHNPIIINAGIEGRFSLDSYYRDPHVFITFCISGDSDNVPDETASYVIIKLEKD